MTPDEACRQGAQAWPSVTLGPGVFAEHLARCVPAGATALPDDLFVADLYLACAGANGEPSALAELTRQLRALVPTAVARIDRSPTFVDEILQGLHETLLVGRPGALPRIAGYRGTGPLGGFLRVAALRAALRAKQRDARVATSAMDVDHVAAPDRGIDVELLQRRFTPAFNDALREALEALEGRPRDVLRMHHAAGQSIDEIAARFGVHRATAARWIVAARVELVRETKKRVQARTRLSDAEVDSVMGLVASKLDLSISRLG